jgi:hypothetical protein
MRIRFRNKSGITYPTGDVGKLFQNNILEESRLYYSRLLEP